MAFLLHPGFKDDYKYANKLSFEHVNGNVTSPSDCRLKIAQRYVHLPSTVADSRNNAFRRIKTHSKRHHNSGSRMPSTINCVHARENLTALIHSSSTSWSDDVLPATVN